MSNQRILCTGVELDRLRSAPNARFCGTKVLPGSSLFDRHNWMLPRNSTQYMSALFAKLLAPLSPLEGLLARLFIHLRAGRRRQAHLPKLLTRVLLVTYTRDRTPALLH